MGVLDVDGILSGRVHLDVLWVALQKVDHWLENQWSVLIYCANGARRSAFVTACYLKAKCITSMQPYRCASVIGHLKMVRRVVVDHLEEFLNWAWLRYFKNVWSPCHRKTLLPFILSDKDFEGCCSDLFPHFRILPAERAEGFVDKLDFDTASGQEDKGDQEGDGKRGKGQKGNTPTAAGQGRKGRRGETLTALGQEGKKGCEVIPMTANDEDYEGAVGNGKKRKTPSNSKIVGSRQKTRCFSEG